LKNKILSFFAVLAVLVTSAPAVPAKTELSERFKIWLNQEVVYIISPLEKEVFMKLSSDRERDLYIDAFWKQRDPTPGTPENEFKTEHYKRITHANRYLGREAAKAGWMTDRGRIYIILGEPNDVQRFQGKQGVYDCEIWFYQGKVDVGLPPGFNLLFFQDGGIGEYKLYSPTQDGAMALMNTYTGSQTDYTEAYQALSEIDPTLAEVSLTLIPGDQAGMYGRPSLVSDVMLQKIEVSPQKLIEDKYAQKFLEYKDIVEVEYTANYLDSDSIVHLIRDPSGVYFVHYSIEPKKLSVNNYASKYYTTLKVNGTVKTMDDRTVYQFDKMVVVELNEAEMKERSGRPFNFHDMFPLIPGDYKLMILVKNEVSKEFSSIEQVLHVPVSASGRACLMTTPLLAYYMTSADPANRKLKPFRFGSRQVYSQPGRIFLRTDTLAVAFQLLDLGDDLKRKGEIKYSFYKDEQLFKETVRKAGDYAEFPDVVESFPMAEFPSAHYRLQISFQADGAEIVSAKDEFDVTFVDVLPRPWVYARVLPEASDPFYSRLIGLQLFNLGRLDEARFRFEEANARQPSADVAAELARTYAGLKEYDKIEPLLAPYLDLPKPPSYDLFFLAARACQAKADYARAIEIYDKAVAHYGTNTSLLNSIGDCYLALGKTAEALAIWERSLSINADQPEIRKSVNLLKNKKAP